MACPLNDVQEAFELFDKNGDGTISASELAAAMRAIGHTPSEEEVAKMLRSVDKDENGVLCLEEFETFLKKEHCADHEELREAFNLFDLNGNGYITKEELIKAMKKIGENLSDDEVGTMIRNADVNKDGHVSFEEFKKMMAPK